MLPYINIREFIIINPFQAAASDVKLAFQYAAGKLGASTDERESSWFCSTQSITEWLLVKLIFTFLLSYPLAGVLKRIPDSKPAYKNLFIVGLVTPKSL